MKWPDRSPLAKDVTDPKEPRAIVYFRLTPSLQVGRRVASEQRTFQTGVSTFNQDLSARAIGATTVLQPVSPLKGIAGSESGSAV